MAAPSCTVELFYVQDDIKHIPAVAKTVSLAFSEDPLVQWLRPNAEPWSLLDGPTCKWQYRRIQRAIFDGLVFRSASVKEVAELSLPKTLNNQKSAVPEVEELSPRSESAELDAGAVVILIPPKSHLKWTIKRAFLACKLWILDSLDPSPEKGTCDKRLDMLSRMHNSVMDKIRAQHQIDNVWYLEILGVHPSLQSRGLGRQVIRWISEYVGNSPIALECTSQKNIRFYEKLGFAVIEEIEMIDLESSTGEESKITFWVMLKDSIKQL